MASAPGANRFRTSHPRSFEPANGLEPLIGAMQIALTIRRLITRQFITAILVQAAMLYGSILVANWLSPEACSTSYWLPSVHCRWNF
jgi:hypothetical protein